MCLQYTDIPKEELILVSDKMIGIVLMNAKRDSNGNPLKPYDFYKVEKHKGKLIIIPIGVNMKEEFMNDIWSKN